MEKGFTKRACLLDVSRNRVLTVERMKVMINRIASYGYNEIFFNIEHAFKIDKHPLIGSEADGYTEAEFKELDDFAAALGLTLIPVFQSFGHMFHILKWSEYSELSESEDKWSVRPDYEGTYELLKDFYKALARTFRSQYIHVGGDEVYDMGSGKSKHLLDSGKTKKELFIEHYVRIQKMLAGFGKKIMIWGDMLEHDAHDANIDGKQADKKEKNLLEQLGPEAIICYWNYATYPMPDFYKTIKNKIYVCPGIHTWRGSFIRKKKAETNLRHIFNESNKIEPYGFIVTDWGDSGHIHPPVFTEQMFEWAIPFFTKGRTTAPLTGIKKLDEVIDCLDDIHTGSYLNSEPVSEHDENELITRLLFHEYLFKGRGFTAQTEKQLCLLLEKIAALEKVVKQLTEDELNRDEFTRGLNLVIRQTFLLKERVELHLAYRKGSSPVELEKGVTRFIIKTRAWFADYMKSWYETSKPMGLYFLIHFFQLTERNMLDEVEQIKQDKSGEPDLKGTVSIYDEDGYRNLYSISDLKALNFQWEKYRI